MDFENNRPHCYTVHHKSHINCPGIGSWCLMSLCHGHELAKCCRGFLQSHSKVINPLKQARSAFFHTPSNSQ
jgi:hypothetical protein